MSRLVATLTLGLVYSFVFLCVSALGAKEIEVRWREVRGNNGYIVELQKGGQKQNKKTQVNRVVFTVSEGGTWQIRVAALNKFGRPARFSRWYELQVKTDQQNEVLTIGKKAQVELTTVIQEKEQPDNPYSRWIPGYPQWQAGSEQHWKSWLYWTALGLIAYEGNWQRQAGNHLADKLENDPALLAVLYYNTDALTGYYLYSNRLQDKNRHAQYQRNQAYLGFAFLAVYGVHLYEVFFNASQSGSFWWGSDGQATQLGFSFSY